MFTSHKLIKITSILICIAFMAACAPAGTQVPPTETSAPPTNTAEPKQLLIGSWTSTVTKEDILRVEPGFDQQYLCDNAGTFVWKFNEDGTQTFDQTAVEADCPPAGNTHFEDKWSMEGNLLTLAPGTADQEIYEISIANDELTLKAKESQCIPCIAINTANSWKQVK